MKSRGRIIGALLAMTVALSGCGVKCDDYKANASYESLDWQITENSGYVAAVEEYTGPKSSHMTYYGVLNDEIIEMAKKYEVVILHPRMGNITRSQVREIQESGTIVLGYISIGEDLRTAGLSPEEMLLDERFTEDKSGPRVDPRQPGDTGLDNVNIAGKASDGGTGYASYYLDDNDHDGKPDINVNFGCAFTNIGDPAWFDVLNDMTFDGIDRAPGIREILTLDYGRGLGCDGLFLDTIDTCAPNAFTADTDANKTRYEWTAPGVLEFTRRLKENYPDKLVLQNRGLFMFNSRYPAFKYNPRQYIDYLLVESYRLDSNSTVSYVETYFLDNKYNYTPKIMAEANRSDGFEVLSLGYAEGPAENHLMETLLGKSSVGMDILMDDIYETQELAGFKHYITDGGVVVVNDFVITHEEKEDNNPPVWTSVYNASNAWPAEPPTPRVGIQQAEADGDTVTVRYDVALDKNPVVYQLYYQDHPFDFQKDPDLTEATCVVLDPQVGDGYDHYAEDVYPNQSVVTGLEKGKKYYLLIRARDDSENRNEEKNEVVISVTTKK